MSTTLSTTMITTTTTMTPWYSLCVEEEQRVRARIFRLSPAAWRSEATRMIRTALPGKVQETVAFVQSMDAFRAHPPLPPAAPVKSEPRTADDVDWKLWQDMVEDPAKYGDDIIEWLDLDAKLRASPKAWRVAAYWLLKEQEAEEDKKREEAAAESARAPYKALYSKIAKQAAAKGMRRWLNRDIKTFVARIHSAATKIQAAVRGHQTRSHLPFLNCCMCLAHRICPLETHVGMMCRACAEQGPYEDITGPVSDPWNWARADYYDRSRQGQCQYDGCLGIPHYEEEAEEMDRCVGCGTYYPAGDMDHSSGYGFHCSRACGPAGESSDWFDHY
jgi:hypothetical protein